MKTIMMPIKCMSEKCKNCPKLKIKVERYFEKNDEEVNILTCKNVDTCDWLYEMMQNENSN